MSHPVFEFLLAHAAGRKSYPKGAHVFHRGDAVRSVFLLETGAVRLSRHHADGSSVILHRTANNRIIAEASLYSPSYHCDCICETGSIVHNLPVQAARNFLANNASLAEQWASYLAHELQSARRHSELLTHQRVAGRLASWLDWHGTLPPKGEWKTLAAQLNVSPEALYREIGKRKLQP